MKYYFGIVLFILSFNCISQDKESFLAAWEKVQENSPEVESFEILGERKYKIKFTTLPFDGELLVLSYGTEDLSYGAEGELYTKTGYIEFDLIGAPEDFAVKYDRSYYKWFTDNTLYFNNETGLWDTQKEYSKHFAENSPGGLWVALLDYWDYLFALLMIYFLFSVFINNKRVKDSVTLQREAISSIDITLAQQNKAMELHQQTNQILMDILEELKARPD